MKTGDSFERCLTFINCHIQPPHGYLRALSEGMPRMSVTLSRETGSGAGTVSEKLAEFLQAHCPDACPWTIFDKNLMEKVMEEHHLPKQMAEFLPENRTSAINDALEELLGLHPSSRTVHYQTAETILHLVELGRVILIGRGANVVTGKLPQVIHVRLVGSFEARLARVREQLQMSQKEAEDFIRRSDQGRAKYLRKYYGKKIDDPLLYDMVLNTDRVAFDEAARLIGETIIARAKALEPARHAAALT